MRTGPLLALPLLAALAPSASVAAGADGVAAVYADFPTSGGRALAVAAAADPPPFPDEPEAGASTCLPRALGLFGAAAAAVGLAAGRRRR